MLFNSNYKCLVNETRSLRSLKSVPKEVNLCTLSEGTNKNKKSNLLFQLMYPLVLCSVINRGLQKIEVCSKFHYASVQ